MSFLFFFLALIRKNTVHSLELLDYKNAEDEKRQFHEEGDEEFFPAAQSLDPANSIFKSLQPLIFIAQMFSLIPVQGILGKDSSRIR